MIKRSEEDLCFLCKVNKADKAGSHFTPIGIIKKVVGKRGYEHEVTIAPSKGEVNQYFGRDNLKNTDPTIRQSDNVADHIFCTACEENLGKIESECIPYLHTIFDKVSQAATPLHTSRSGNSFIKFSNPNKNVLILFFYSIIWRQILNDFLSHGLQHPKDFFETLRKIVSTEISKPLNEIKKSEVFKDTPALIIFTCKFEDIDLTSLIYNPNPYPANPEVFSIGIYETLIFKEPHISQHYELSTKLPASVVDDDLIINIAEQGIIGVMDLEVWNNRNKWFFAKTADDFITTYVNKIVNATRLPFSAAEALLKAETHLIGGTTKAKTYADFFTEAVESVIRKYKS